MPEFLRRDPNNVHLENVRITLDNGTEITQKMGFSMDPEFRAQSAKNLLGQYPKSTEINVTGNNGEDWGTYKK